ncbi:hypothetical protein ACFE04_010940 [Oxalis oulophora]
MHASCQVNILLLSVTHLSTTLCHVISHASTCPPIKLPQLHASGNIQLPQPPASTTGEEGFPPGKPMSMEQTMLDKGAEMIQSLKPDFLQCAVYDSDDTTGRLIGVEYIISDRLFEALVPKEQKLWHSHTHEIKSGLWVHPQIPEMLAKPELESLAKTYGKFWCTWQTDRGDTLPIGPPALMMSPQAASLSIIKPELVKKRDDKYNISTEALKAARREAINEPERINPQADYWKQHGICFAIDIEKTELKKRAPFP